MDYSNYLKPLTAWNGIFKYMTEHPDTYGSLLNKSFTEEELLKVIKKQAQSVLSPKEYDTFRKAITSLQKGTAVTIKKENIYRLLFVLHLNSDTEAQDLLMNYLHQNELSARSLDEFIIIASLKIGLSWEDTCTLRERYAEAINKQSISPSEIAEGQTSEVYYSIINKQLHCLNDLTDYLDQPANLSFFSKTRNTQYLALFDDIELDTIYNGDNEQVVRLYTDYGSMERVTIQHYYYSLFGMADEGSPDCLTDEEIMKLADIYENVFMSYDNFCLLVQRRRPVDISSGTFLLGLFKKLLTDDEDDTDDFYVNFLDSEEFKEVINDILIYFGFPVINPDLDPFERLILDIYYDALKSADDLDNEDFQQLFLDKLRTSLKEIAHSF